VILEPLEPGGSQAAGQIPGLTAMIARQGARLRALARERDDLVKLLDEADAALAKAGVPYQQGNIRERISAYQVFRRKPLRHH
jgi:hypothetical protein